MHEVGHWLRLGNVVQVLNAFWSAESLLNSLFLQYFGDFNCDFYWKKLMEKGFGDNLHFFGPIRCIFAGLNVCRVSDLPPPPQNSASWASASRQFMAFLRDACRVMFM